MNRWILVFLAGLLALASTGCSGMVSGNSPSTPAMPAIATQPTSQTVTVGQTATFSVGATGTGPLGYQWQRNNSAIAGATSSIYTTPATKSSDNGEQFAVTINNTAGSVTSGAVTLTVSATAVAPTVTTQ